MVAVKTTPAVVEITIDNAQNSPLLFRPLKRKIRGGFAFHRCREPGAATKAGMLVASPPGQRLGLNLETGEGYIVEPLREPQHAALLHQIRQKLNMDVAPERQTFKNIHRPTWLFFMNMAVRSGTAKLTTGEFPDDFGGEPQTDYLTKKKASPIEQFTLAIERLLARLAPAAAATATAAATAR